MGRPIPGIRIRMRAWVSAAMAALKEGTLSKSWSTRSYFCLFHLIVTLRGMSRARASVACAGVSVTCSRSSGRAEERGT